MWAQHAVLLTLGIVVLACGGEWLVRGAARLAQQLGISALVVGLTVVAFGTSAPEAAVTLFAAVGGSADLALGNVVGSNIANILLILGIAALLRPMRVAKSMIRVDGPVMILAAIALMMSGTLSGAVTRPVGLAFVAVLIGYTVFTYQLARRTGPTDEPEPPPLTGWGRYAGYNTLLVVVGIAALVLGARLIVDGASGVARLLHVSEHVIGLTIVAVGTSLPELATAIVAARRGQADLAIGNVVGSNIFNVLFVAGSAAAVRPLAFPAALLHMDGWLMVGVCVAFYPIAITGRRISRGEGAALLTGYAAYLGYTVITALR